MVGDSVHSPQRLRVSSFWLIVDGILVYFRSFGLSLADSFGFLNIHEGRQFHIIVELIIGVFQRAEKLSAVDFGWKRKG